MLFWKSSDERVVRFLASMTDRQRSHHHLSFFLSQICGLLIVLAAYFGLWGLNWRTWGGLGFIVALCGVCYATCCAVARLIVRPEPGLGPDDPIVMPNAPWWWVVACPLILWLVIAVGPQNAWALLTVAGASIVLVLVQSFLWPMQGAFVTALDDFKSNRGTFESVLDSLKDKNHPS